ncbi:hypothetical protein evm_006630 [Chilo suppressalis]|nr:hypothetical protein evm_006630 [Chilo suppressalis]
MIKYICQTGYTLVGNRYSTCTNGQWDTPIPICVKPGCIVPILKHGLTVPSVAEAWVGFFCMPGYKLVGSPAIYCDGRHWNATAPTCIDSSVTSNLSCNFESPDLCGWTQDALHDFDWERLNKKTPSYFLFTGPSYDHTYGKEGSGYYMYIESSSRVENDTARLLSPIYEAQLAYDGCFAFFYHMYGKYTGGLRVYQKPDSLGLEEMLRQPEGLRQKYLLFEQWGNQGDVWYGEVAQLRNFSDNFQIVVEGIRGKKFTSDIAIDDVAILQGENCTLAESSITTPTAFLPDSCDGRCVNSTVPLLKPQLGCSCHINCLTEENCCTDFFEICFYNNIDSTLDDSDQSSTTVELPQTQKLVAKTSTPLTTTTTTEATTTKKIITTKLVPTTVKPKTTTVPQKTTKKAVTTTTDSAVKVTVTVFQKDEIKDTPKHEPTASIFKLTSTTTLTPATKKYTTKTTKVVNKFTTLKPITKAPIKKLTTNIPGATKALRDTGGKKGSADVFGKPPEKKQGSGWKTFAITAVALLCCAGLLWVAVGARGARGRAALAYLRGRVRHDPEVRYLHSSANDED